MTLKVFIETFPTEILNPRYSYKTVIVLKWLQKWYFFKAIFTSPGPVVQKVDNGIHWINHYPVDRATGFPNIYPLDSNLSGGWCYPAFEQPEPGV